MTLPEIYQDYMALQERQQSLEEKRVSLSKFCRMGVIAGRLKSSQKCFKWSFAFIHKLIPKNGA